MRKAKTIDQLYEEVSKGGFDYVLTNDAPLATALNAKIDDYRLDGFAYTPKAVAGIVATSILRGKTLSDLEVIDAIEKETGFDFRYIHSEVQNIRDIRRYTADVPKYLYSKRSRKVYDAYMQLPTLEKVMDIYDPTVYRSFLTGKKVAVIGAELFDDLDKHFIPTDFTDIDAYTDGDYEIETIHAIGNDRQIAGSIVDLITAETCNDTAIVLDSKGAVADAVRSAMYRKGIPFKNSLDVKDLAQVRDFIQFLDLALDFETIRAGDVRELFSVYQTGKNKNRGRELIPEYDRYLLSRVPLGDDVEEVTAKLIDTMRNVRYLTFGYVMDRMMSGLPQRASVAILLENMGLTDKTVTPALVARLSYAVNNIDDLKHNEQVPENEKRGVLLADSRNSVYVDRSFVIYIGLDESWENTASGKDYVDKEQLDEDNAFRLGILLQQGTSRVYAVKPVTKGKETAPCPTFQTVYSMNGRPREIASFRDICTNYVTGSWFRETPRVPPVRSGIEIGESDSKQLRFSKSSYNAYADCPIKFMFSKLIPGEDNEYTVFGNCLHEFAEFYFCYPEIVKERGLDHYVDQLDELYAGMSSECQKGIDTSRFRVYMNNIVRYIDLVRPETVPLDAVLSKRKYPNLFMRQEGLDMCSTYTESEMTSAHPIFAKFDVCFGNQIVDYKTGKAKDASEIIAGFTRRGKNLAEFQAMIYLQVLSENTDARPCRFNLFFLGDNDIASVREDFDVRRNVRPVVLCEETSYLLAFGPDGTLRSDISQVGKYAELFRRWDEVSDLLIEIYERSETSCDTDVTMMMNRLGLKDTKTNAGMVSGLLKKADTLMAKSFLVDRDGNIMIPSDSMRRFLEQLSEDRRTAEEEMKVPIYDLRKGSITCRKCSYYRACLKGNVEEDEEVEE